MALCIQSHITLVLAVSECSPPADPHAALGKESMGEFVFSDYFLLLVSASRNKAKRDLTVHFRKLDLIFGEFNELLKESQFK